MYLLRLGMVRPPVVYMYTGIYQYVLLLLNPYLTNGFPHHYQLGESTFFLWVLGVFFIYFFISLFDEISPCKQDSPRIAPDGTPRSAASHLGLYCSP